MPNKPNKYEIRYRIPGRGDTLTAFVDAPDGGAARNMGENMFGRVSSVINVTPFGYQAPNAPPLDIDTEDGPLQSIGRSLAREQLGIVGESLSDRTISVLMLLVLGLPVVGLWLGFPVYKASLIAPTMGFPPVTLCIGVGVVAFCVGWLILYLCSIFFLQVVGFVVYAGWFILYVAGWHLDADLLQGVFVRVLMTNTDATNLQKVGVLFAGLAGFSVMGNLGKVARES